MIVMSESSSDLQLSGKVAIVTGSARGIGAAIARTYGAAKCCVVIADRMKRTDGLERAESMAMDIRRKGGQALVMKVDISDPTQVETMIQTTIEKFGRLDIFVANAGIFRAIHTLETTRDDLDEFLDINLKGTFYGCQLAAKQMVKQGSGKIIVISSVDGLEANEANLPYSMSKAALSLLVKCMAVDLGSSGINVNGIAPGWIETEMTHMTEGLTKEFQKRVPLGRLGKPENIAGGALFLASSLSDYVTGHVLVIDGGQTINISIRDAST